MAYALAKKAVFKILQIVFAVAVCLLAVKMSWLFCGPALYTWQWGFLGLGLAYVVYTLFRFQVVEILFGLACMAVGSLFFSEIYPLNFTGGLLFLAGALLVYDNFKELIDDVNKVRSKPSRSARRLPKKKHAKKAVSKKAKKKAAKKKPVRKKVKRKPAKKKTISKKKVKRKPSKKKAKKKVRHKPSK